MKPTPRETKKIHENYEKEQENNIVKLDWKDIIITQEKQLQKYMQKNHFHIRFVKKMQYKDILKQMIR